MIIRDLEKVRAIVDEATGLEIAYAYEDLVFPDHTAFIIQFDDTDAANFFCYFHNDCNLEDKIALTGKLMDACYERQCKLAVKGSFSLEQEGEHVNIHFNNRSYEYEKK